MDRTLKTVLLALAIALLTTGCLYNMRDQPRFEALEPSDIFEDGRSSRPLIENTVARGHLRVDQHLYNAVEDGAMAQTYPFEITEEVLLRGQERFNIYCSPCHGYTGDGNGMIVQRGMKQPRSFHDPNVAAQPPGYYFNTMTNGFGAMYSYASRVKPEDRWAIAAYIQALQLSQSVTFDEVPAEVQEELEKAGSVQ